MTSRKHSKVQYAVQYSKDVLANVDWSFTTFLSLFVGTFATGLCCIIYFSLAAGIPYFGFDRGLLTTPGFIYGPFVIGSAFVFILEFVSSTVAADKMQEQRRFDQFVTCIHNLEHDQDRAYLEAALAALKTPKYVPNVLTLLEEKIPAEHTFSTLVALFSNQQFATYLIADEISNNDLWKLSYRSPAAHLLYSHVCSRSAVEMDNFTAETVVAIGKDTQLHEKVLCAAAIGLSQSELDPFLNQGGMSSEHSKIDMTGVQFD